MESRWKVLGSFIVGCVIGLSAGVFLGVVLSPYMFPN
jgi:hypothetical protein